MPQLGAGVVLWEEKIWHVYSPFRNQFSRRYSSMQLESGIIQLDLSINACFEVVL